MSDGEKTLLIVVLMIVLLSGMFFGAWLRGLRASREHRDGLVNYQNKLNRLHSQLGTASNNRKKLQKQYSWALGRIQTAKRALDEVK